MEHLEQIETCEPQYNDDGYCVTSLECGLENTVGYWDCDSTSSTCDVDTASEWIVDQHRPFHLSLCLDGNYLMKFDWDTYKVYWYFDASGELVGICELSDVPEFCSWTTIGYCGGEELACDPLCVVAVVRQGQPYPLELVQMTPASCSAGPLRDRYHGPFAG